LVSLQNLKSEEQARVSTGRLFHTRAAATGKARSPRVTRRVDGTCSVVVSSERRHRRATLLLNSKAPEQMTAQCWRWRPRRNRLASSTSCFDSSACLQSLSCVLCRTAYGLESPEDRLGGTHAEGADHPENKTDSSRVALVLCRWNTLLIVLEALGLSRHCRQKCDIRAISDERLHCQFAEVYWP